MDKVDLNYGVKDIKTLEGIEAIRLRPGMYIGSTGPEGVKQITLEIISNAVDEYLNGYCTKCDIYIGEDDNVTIIDNGRGIPFGKAKDGSETLENIKIFLPNFILELNLIVREKLDIILQVV